MDHSIEELPYEECLSNGEEIKSYKIRSENIKCITSNYF